MPEPMPSADTPRVPAVDRAVRLIDALAASHEPLALAELARRLALPKSSVHGLLATLVAHGLARRNDDGEFCRVVATSWTNEVYIENDTE